MAMPIVRLSGVALLSPDRTTLSRPDAQPSDIAPDMMKGGVPRASYTLWSTPPGFTCQRFFLAKPVDLIRPDHLLQMRRKRTA